MQLSGLASLPRWATSRWILAQAAQCLDQRSQARVAKAMEIAVEAHGGEAALMGTEDLEARANVVDHDWLFRQLFLYELGGLQHFVGRVASRDLLAEADRIHDWARAPMGGFRLIHESPGTLIWSDLATGEEVETVNIGTASLMEVDEWAIGRLVPVQGGVMFESAPLVVPAHVARQVADDPPEWVGAVCTALRETASEDEEIITDAGYDFRLLTDVPRVLQQLVALALTDESGGGPASVETVADLTRIEVGLLRAALDGRLAGLELPWCPWPSVAATMLDRRVGLSLRQGLRDDDRPKLEALAPLLAGAAGEVCLALAEDLASAA